MTNPQEVQKIRDHFEDEYENVADRFEHCYRLIADLQFSAEVLQEQKIKALANVNYWKAQAEWQEGK